MYFLTGTVVHAQPFPKPSPRVGPVRLRCPAALPSTWTPHGGRSSPAPRPGAAPAPPLLPGQAAPAAAAAAAASAERGESGSRERAGAAPLHAAAPGSQSRFVAGGADGPGCADTSRRCHPRAGRSGPGAGRSAPGAGCGRSRGSAGQGCPAARPLAGSRCASLPGPLHLCARAALMTRVLGSPRERCSQKV